MVSRLSLRRLTEQPTGYLTAGIFFCLTLLGLVVQSSIFGSPTSETIGFWVGALFYCFLPGLLIYLWLAPQENNWAMMLGMGWLCGMLLQIVILLPLSALGSVELFRLLPTSLPLLLFMVYLKRGRVQNVYGPPLLYVAGLLLLIALVTASSLYFSPRVLFQEARVVHHDIVFHAGNIADVMYRWPLSDPRIAGEPQNYHFFSYFVPIGLALPTDMPLTNLLMRHLPGLGAWVLALQLFNAGWVASKRVHGGLIAGFMILFHTDVGWAITRTLNLENSVQSGSTLAESGYGSISTLFGSIFIAAFLLYAYRWLSFDQSTYTDHLMLVFLAAVCAGTKSSLMPAILVGLIAVIGWRFLLQRQLSRRLRNLLALTLPVSTIVLIAVVSGEGGFTSYLTIKPGAALVRTPLYNTITGGGSSILGLAFSLPLWVLAYLGLGSIGTLIYTVLNWRDLDDFALWTWFSLLAGLTVALTFDFFADERFFIDGPQVMMALLTAAAIGQLGQLSVRKRFAVGLLLVLFALPIGLYIIQRMRSGLSNSAYTYRILNQPIEPAVDDYLLGLNWMRTNLPSDALLMTDHAEIFLSAYAERETYYETYRVGPLNNALAQQGFEGEYYPEKAALRSTFYTPGVDLTAAIDELTEFNRPTYVIVDNVDVSFRNGYSWKVNNLTTASRLDSPALIEVYASSSMRVYLIVESGK